MLSWIAQLKPSWYFWGVLSWCAVRCVNTIYQECILTWYVFIRHMFTSIQRSNVRTRSAKKHIKIHLCNPAWWEARADVFWVSSYVDESRLRGFTLIWLLFYAVYHLFVFFSMDDDDDLSKANLFNILSPLYILSGCITWYGYWIGLIPTLTTF